MAEGAALEMPCTLSGYRGFESPSLRHFPRGMRISGFDCEGLGSPRRTCAYSGKVRRTEALGNAESIPLSPPFSSIRYPSLDA